MQWVVGWIQSRFALLRHENPRSPKDILYPARTWRRLTNWMVERDLPRCDWWLQLSSKERSSEWPCTQKDVMKLGKTCLFQKNVALLQHLPVIIPEIFLCWSCIFVINCHCIYSLYLFRFFFFKNLTWLWRGTSNENSLSKRKKA